MRIEYTARARENLSGIRQHYQAVGGRGLALRMVRTIRQGIAALADNPQIAPPYALVPGIRRLVVAGGGFLVFYREMDRIEVLHVRRAERSPVADNKSLGSQ